MISRELHTLSLSATSGLVAFLMVYDARRAVRPRIAGEKVWRGWRVLSTTLAIGGLVVLQRAQVAWLRWTAATALVLSLPFILWCSVALKRLVAGTLLYRQDDH